MKKLLWLFLLLPTMVRGQACATGSLQTGLVVNTNAPLCTQVTNTFDVVNRNVSAGTLTGTLVASAVNGMYGLRIESVPYTTGSLGTEIVSISWTQNATVHTVVLPTLALAVISNTLNQVMPIYPDAGTAITYSVAVAGTGSFDLHIDGRPPSV